ncbi:HipA family kinase, partial [Nocardiopsis changdeensis]
YDFRHHALGHSAPDTRAADAELAPKVTEELLREITAEVPDAWLLDEPGFATAEQAREAYGGYLHARVRASASWLPSDFP